MTPLLEATHAAFRYPGGADVVGPFSLAVYGGELHHVRGPSGCGKSTFARMLAGLIPHLYRGKFSGEVRAGAHRTDAVPLWQLSAQVGLVGQNPAAQVLAATVRDEILFGLENLGGSRAEMKAHLDSTLDAFGLRALEHRDPRTLSGGEQQKVVLAAIAARRPQVIVLDEALSMLDPTSVADVAAHVERLRRDGTAVVAFEHRPPVYAWRQDARCQALARAPSAVAPAAPGADGRADSPLPELRHGVAPFALHVQDIGVTLRGRRVLDSINLTLAGGQVVGLVGANGAGKTTLLRALAGLQPHTGYRRDDRGGTPRLGLCFQNPDQQLFNPTVRQEILYGNAAVDTHLYRRVVELLGLGPYENTPPLLLSEGEKKRLALAILLTRPGLSGVCLDEPTLGQDDGHRRRIGRVVRHLASAGYLCVVATHDLEWAAEWCDELVPLHEGRMVKSRNDTTRQQPDVMGGQCQGPAAGIFSTRPLPVGSLCGAVANTSRNT